MAGVKEQRWFTTAEELVVIKGYSYDRVAAHIAALGGSVSKGTLSNWSKKGDWQNKRQRYLQTARGVAPELKKQLEEKIRQALSDTGHLNPEALKEINHLLRLINAIEKQGPDFRISALEVMGKFAEFARDHAEDNYELETVSRLVGGFLAEVERQAA